MTKERRVYQLRIIGGKVMLQADLERLHKYMREIERVEAISDEMRERSTEAAETNTKKGQVWFKRNAAIEAFWTHARNLIEFLTREKSPDLTVSSASAQDFTEDFHSTLEMETLMDKINAQISHLGYGRTIVDYEKLGYEISYVKPALDSQIKRFEDKLDAESRKHWVQRTPETVRGPDKSSYTSRAATTSASFDYTGPARGR
jgi:hypothetical protein